MAHSYTKAYLAPGVGVQDGQAFVDCVNDEHSFAFVHRSGNEVSIYRPLNHKQYRWILCKPSY